jgi:hypothetical protein
MNDVFKPYLLGSIEEYLYKVIYSVNGINFYMKVWAENEDEAAKKVRGFYTKSELIEILEVNEI